MNPSSKNFGFYIDVFSYCNLRCPSCLVGNKYGDIQAWPRGLMSPELLGQILDKAQSECNVQWVGLYNWTEPLLHPELPRLVRAVKCRGVPCWLSSNLNVLSRPEELLAEGPDFLRISLSGFTQPVYELGHRGGDIEQVKRNMACLARAKASTGAATKVQVFYHRYLDNIAEMRAMEEFARSLGFEFGTILAQVLPVEKIIDIAENRITARDRDLLARLALPLDRALALTAATSKASCTLLEDVFALDVKGDVMLCCSSSMERINVIANFLDYPLEELQRRRREKTLCGACLKHGIPDYVQASYPEFETIAAETIARAAERREYSLEPVS